MKQTVRRVFAFGILALLLPALVSCGSKSGVVAHSAWSSGSVAIPVKASAVTSQRGGGQLTFKSRKTRDEIAASLQGTVVTEGLTVSQIAGGLLFQQRLEVQEGKPEQTDFYYMIQLPDAKMRRLNPNKLPKPPRNSKTKRYVLTNLLTGFQSVDNYVEILFPAYLLRGRTDALEGEVLPMDEPLEFAGSLYELQKFYEAFGRYSTAMVKDDFVITGYKDLPPGMDAAAAPHFA
ncbi:MAG: hypothetical protein FWH26_09825 [Oscillospiraceae bacterium]|nr:hypothetical protein [Oscillospiraceae bacterium]